MIYTFRLINGWERVDYRKFFSLEDHHYNLRGHSKKIARTNLNLGVRKFFFSRRVIEKWNSLSEEEVSATSTAAFKAKYDKLEKMGDSTLKILPHVYVLLFWLHIDQKVPNVSTIYKSLSETY